MLRLLWWECTNAQAPLMRMYQYTGSSDENVPMLRLLWWECANAQAPLMRMCQCTGSYELSGFLDDVASAKISFAGSNIDRKALCIFWLHFIWWLVCRHVIYILYKFCCFRLLLFHLQSQTRYDYGSWRETDSSLMMVYYIVSSCHKEILNFLEIMQG